MYTIYMNYLIIFILIIIIFSSLIKKKEAMISTKVKLVCNKINNEYVCEEKKDRTIEINNINNILSNSKEYANSLYLKIQTNFNKQNDDLNKVINS